jgi:succinate dehydrogenase/fumarate reductase-like Fe-S protein
VEFSGPEERTPEILEIIKKVSGEIDTVISLDVACRAGKDGSWPL